MHTHAPKLGKGNHELNAKYLEIMYNSFILIVASFDVSCLDIFIFHGFWNGELMSSCAVIKFLQISGHFRLDRQSIDDVFWNIYFWILKISELRKI